MQEGSCSSVQVVNLFDPTSPGKEETVYTILPLQA